MQTLSEAEKALGQYIPDKDMKGIYSLERIIKLMEYLNNPQEKIKVVHVAGTSGKTSTCYYIAAMLRAALRQSSGPTGGQKVGLTISPYVDKLNERVQLNGQPLPELEFSQKLGQFIEIVNKSGIKPTYFELVTAFAYWYFAAAKVDYAVIETGLGGLLDASNVVKNPNKICVITDIGLDHVDILGKTLAEIARQKAGIIHEQNQVFMYEQASQITNEISHAALGKNANVTFVPELKLSEIELEELPQFQRRNWWLALAVYDFISERDNLKALNAIELSQIAKLVIPARMEETHLPGGKTLIRDGAHNSDKMQALVKALKQKYPNQSIAVLLAMVDSPDFKQRLNLKPLLSLAGRLIITGFGLVEGMSKSSINPQVLAEHCRELGAKDVEVIVNPDSAFKELLKSKENVLLATGSLYLMNHVKPLAAAH